MKLSELAAQIDAAIKEHGDLTVFDDDFFSLIGINVELTEDLPWLDKSWNMPEKFAQIRSYK